ncbi:MAG TPA: aminotransferase class V-fold PLP-dependent enzyme [Bryobacteraceae bacterium]|nr:aminotransferase class V-fold PLP-dependent enzyme [Bryobacteraceae bacterium]
MPNRRNFLRSALAAPLFTSASEAQQLALPARPAKLNEAAYWSMVRDQFSMARDKVFFNNGTVGAMPKPVVDRMVAEIHRMATDVAEWDYRGTEWIGGYGDYPEIRGKVAKLINANEKEISLTENNTCSMSYLAAGIDLPPNSEILITDQEHPGGQSPWLNAAKRHGGTVVKAAIPKPAHSSEEMFEIVQKAITPRTRVIAISHMISASGAILPVREICGEARKRGIFTVLDGAQTAGHIAIDVKDIGCDAYVSCFHKWLMAPAGNGFLYLRAERNKEVWPTMCNGNFENQTDNGYRLSQRGTGSLPVLMGADAAMDFHFQIGPERVQQRIKYLGDYLRDGLRGIPKVKLYTPSDPKINAGITVYGIDGYNGAQLQDEMWNRARLRPRSSAGIALRQSTHIFNSPEEIDRTLRVVRELAKA